MARSSSWWARHYTGRYLATTGGVGNSCLSSPACRRKSLHFFSSDGKWIAYVTFQTGKWSDLLQTTIDFPNWSRNGQYVYFLHYPENPAALRIRINDRKLEQVADLKGFLATGFWGFWLGD
jgi:hypothetical protein